ncbi:MAG: hypothetical protein WAU91_04385 [Desulfatitalea sp.]
MEKELKKILELENVNGCLLVSPEGQVQYSEFPSQAPRGLEQCQWRALVDALDGIHEADALFENARLYIRSSPTGYLLVFLDLYAAIAMIRLQCDVLIPTLKPQAQEQKGLRRFFTKKE